MKYICAYLLCALILNIQICSGCTLPVMDQSGSDAKTAIPRTAPSIIGQVTALALPTIIVEEKPTEPHGSAKARVRITNDTQVLRRGEDGMGTAKLQVGQQVKVWFIGPVMESYPLQATAGVIVIE